MNQSGIILRRQWIGKYYVDYLNKKWYLLPSEKLHMHLWLVLYLLFKHSNQIWGMNLEFSEIKLPI